MHHLLEHIAGDHLLVLISFLRNEARLLGNIRGVEKQYAFGRQSIAAGAAGFLIISLEVFWQIMMDHKPHIRFVDAHAEGNGGAHHTDLVANEGFLISRAHVFVQSRVICGGAHAVFIEHIGQPLGASAAGAINDAAVLRLFVDPLEHLPLRLRAREDAVNQIGAIKAGHEFRRIAQFQLGDDVRPHAVSGRGGERHKRQLGKSYAELGNLAVFRPEIMTPFADAMGFVDGDGFGLPLGEPFEHPIEHQSLGRDVEQSIVAIVQTRQTAAGFVSIES